MIVLAFHLLISQTKNGRPDLAFLFLESFELHLDLSERLKTLIGISKHFHNTHASLAESDDNFIFSIRVQTAAGRVGLSAHGEKTLLPGDMLGAILQQVKTQYFEPARALFTQAKHDFILAIAI